MVLFSVDDKLNEHCNTVQLMHDVRRVAISINELMICNFLSIHNKSYRCTRIVIKVATCTFLQCCTIKRTGSQIYHTKN